MNAAWEKSFAWVDCNKKAIAVRGWNPLTRNLLDHHETAETQEIAPQENQENSQETVASTLNFGTRVANKVMVDILQNIDRENVRSQIRQNQEQGRQSIETLAQCKKLSAGAVFKSGRAMLGPDVLQAALQRKMQKDEVENDKVVRKYLKKCAEITNLAQSLWSVSQLKALISFKKRKTDTWQQPKNKAQLIERWNAIKNREIPLPSPAQNEQQDDDDDEEDTVLQEAV